MVGPVLIYDKSVLDCLNPNEALLLQKLFIINVTPVLFLEVIADLKEQPRIEGMTAEQFVTKLATKLPFSSSNVNAHHERLIRLELLQISNVQMKRCPIETKTPLLVRSDDGRKGLYYDESDEEKAMAMWKDGRFTDFDRHMADRWKQTQKDFDLARFAHGMKNHFKDVPAIKDLDALKIFIEQRLDMVGRTYPFFLLKAMCDRFLDDPTERAKCLIRWKIACRKQNRIIHPKDFGPYAYYVYTVEFFYVFGLGQEIIKSSKRSKSHIDLQYLYYLPFCMTFASNDGEHKKMVPRFLNSDQNFMDGMELKRDLAKNIAYIQSLSPEERDKFKKGYPLLAEDSIICKTFDSFSSTWRQNKIKEPERKNPEQDRKIIKEMTKISKETIKKGIPLTFPINDDEIEFVVKMRRMNKSQLMREFDLSEEKAEEIIKAEKADS